ncbi:MAG: hypothetical protein IJ594_01845 [Oscillospiraceae bacterium]|nr:hypothetical protein [Oscillospiraceae bacterium]
MTGLYRIAERNIRIVSLHAAVHDYCRDYRAQGEPDFTVETGEAEIARERALAAREDLRAGREPRPYGDAYLEQLAVYRAIAERMPQFDTLLVHGSALAVDGEGYLFTAPSGTGKSTHARLWRELLGERAVTLNDDKPLLRVGAEGVTVYGTPYDGKHRLSRNAAAPLKALCLLERGAENRIEQVTPGEIYTLLLQQVYRPADPAALAAALRLLDGLLSSVRLYRLRCTPEPAAAQLAYAVMKGRET